MEGDKIDLGVSDWITFLSNEKFGVMNAMVGLVTVFVAVIAFLVTYAAPDWYKSAGVAIFFIYMCIWYFGKGKYFNGKHLYERGKVAGNILEKIMKGDEALKDTESIRKEWLTGIKGLS